MQGRLTLLLALSLLTGCDRLYERMGLPDPAKVLAEGKAIGGACRHAGRGLEDCYTLNPTASKAAIYEGWKEMNEYMAKHGLQAIPPQIDPAKRKSAAVQAEAMTEDSTKPLGGPGEDTEAKAVAGKKKAEKTAAGGDEG